MRYTNLFSSPFFSTNFYMPPSDWHVSIGTALRTVKIETDETKSVLTINVAGCSSSDVSITVEDQYMNISAKLIAYAERYSLSRHTDIGAITAKVVNGVLTVTLPFNQFQSLSRVIPVQ